LALQKGSLEPEYFFYGTLKRLIEGGGWEQPVGWITLAILAQQMKRSAFQKRY
jgi:hypothetical protein